MYAVNPVKNCSERAQTRNVCTKVHRGSEGSKNGGGTREREREKSGSRCCHFGSSDESLRGAALESSRRSEMRSCAVVMGIAMLGRLIFLSLSGQTNVFASRKNSLFASDRRAGALGQRSDGDSAERYQTTRLRVRVSEEKSGGKMMKRGQCTHAAIHRPERARKNWAKTVGIKTPNDAKFHRSVRIIERAVCWRQRECIVHLILE